jgi:hypothetical protein
MLSRIKLFPPAAVYKIKSFMFSESFHFLRVSSGHIQDMVRLKLSDIQNRWQQVLKDRVAHSSVFSEIMWQED